MIPEKRLDTDDVYIQVSVAFLQLTYFTMTSEWPNLSLSWATDQTEFACPDSFITAWFCLSIIRLIVCYRGREGDTQTSKYHYCDECAALFADDKKWL